MFLPANITLQFGDSGDFVAELQRRLAKVGAFDEMSISGFFDGITVNGVSSFQARMGIRADGIAGPETLRKLNGVIADGGSSSSSSSNQEEAAKEAQRQAMQWEMLQHQEQAAQEATPAGYDEVAPVEVAVPETLHAEPVIPVPEAAPAAQPLAAAPAIDPAEMLARIMAQHQANTTPSAPEMRPEQAQHQVPLARQQAVEMRPEFYSQHQVQQQIHLDGQAQHQAPPLGRPELSPLQNSPEAQQQAQYEAMMQREAAPQMVEQIERAQAPARSMVGRVLEKMDALMQRLSEYFEQKLPNHVLNEVQKIGQVLAQSGVQEVAIPTGPEPQQAQLPARGPEQQGAGRG